MMIWFYTEVGNTNVVWNYIIASFVFWKQHFLCNLCCLCYNIVMAVTNVISIELLMPPYVSYDNISNYLTRLNVKRWFECFYNQIFW